MISMLGILFDIDQLGGGFYGYAAYQIFFDALNTHQLVGCVLYHGDTNATLQGSANQYCIAIASVDETEIDLMRDVFWAYHAKGLLPLPIRFLEHDQVSQEPLIPAGFITSAGVVGDRTGWITEAWEKSQEKHETEMN